MATGTTRSDAGARAFDYVVVGAGSAGCAVASRLAETCSTLLLEAGGPDSGMRDGEELRAFIEKPDNVIRSWATPITKGYPTEPGPHLAGRSINIFRGIVRGGSHAVNGMIYVRGNRRDYDTWARLGNDGWSFAEVLPSFKAAECFDGRPLPYEPRDLAYHGDRGPMNVRPLPNPTAAAGAFIEAARELGYRDSCPQWDFNGHRQESAAGLYQTTVTPDGRRSNTAFAYLDSPAISRRPTTLTGAQVTRIVIEGGRAVGVECTQGGGKKTYRADREVILTAGAFGSPQLLMLSGIGPADELRRFGIKVQVDLPGVGGNLQDHLQILIFHPAAKDPGQSSFTAEAGLFLSTRDHSGTASPDLQYHVLGRLPPLFPALEQSLALPPYYFLICPVLCSAQTRGRLSLRSARPGDDPIIQPNYLECEADVDILIRGTELARDLARARPLREFGDAGQPFAVDGASQHRVVPSGRGPEARELVRNTAGTVWHPAGTCKMGRDRLAVVDPELRVYGVEGLRVADASIIPLLPSGNINAAAIMIGEQCARIVLGRRGPAPGLPTDEGTRGDAVDPWRMPADLLRLLSEVGRGTGAADVIKTGVAGADYGQIIQLLGRVMVAYATGGLRYWGRMAEIWARALPSMGRAFAERGVDSSTSLTDDLRTYLRELAELPAQEARRFQAELEKVLRGDPPRESEPPAGDDAPWRRWEVKP